ncbi:MAG: PaaI family thioesterase [Rhizomicrobium sp.]
MDRTPPDGFIPWTKGGSAVTAPWEPIFERPQDDAVFIGMFMRDATRNRRGLLHGGVIATLCDIAMGHSCALAVLLRNSETKGLLTTHLAVDYIGKAETGWMEIRPRVLHAGASSAIADAIVFANDGVIARATATFRTQTGR